MPDHYRYNHSRRKNQEKVQDGCSCYELVTAEMHLIGRTPDPAARQLGRNCSAGQTALFRCAKRRMGTVCMTVRDVIWPTWDSKTNRNRCIVGLPSNSGWRVMKTVDSTLLDRNCRNYGLYILGIISTVCSLTFQLMIHYRLIVIRCLVF